MTQRSSKTFDYTIFILSHKNPNGVITVKSLNRHGYTGDYYIVLDSEDDTIEQYIQNFGEDKILVFDKSKVAETFDEFGKHLGDRNTVVYARNACFDFAKELGYKYFIEFDDDYREFNFRFAEDRRLRVLAPTNLDDVFDTLLTYYKECPQIKSLCMAQNGDFLGGVEGANLKKRFMRKAMNSFICSTDRPFKFLGRINEDVNTYALLGSRGELFCSVIDVNINQLDTQQKDNEKGMTGAYVGKGTYLKSFYSVICCPSFVTVGIMGNNHGRIHHNIDWRHAVPNIISDRYKKEDKDSETSSN